MRVITLRIGECEHEGDVEAVIEDITACEGKVTDYRLNEESETCVFFVEVESPAQFIKAFETTESGHFL